tara:strand:+ start:533 stop:829 length:297 start_codon:yes stop_codon:yes gene_type:complete
MKFKDLTNHYETLDKKELIKILNDKNILLLKQEDEIERLTKELKRVEDIEKDHKKLVGNTLEDNKLLASEVAKKNNEIEQLKKQLDNPLNKMREVGGI